MVYFALPVMCFYLNFTSYFSGFYSPLSSTINQTSPYPLSSFFTLNTTCNSYDNYGSSTICPLGSYPYGFTIGNFTLNTYNNIQSDILQFTSNTCDNTYLQEAVSDFGLDTCDFKYNNITICSSFPLNNTTNNTVVCDTSKGFKLDDSGKCGCDIANNFNFINGSCLCDTTLGFTNINGTCVCNSNDGYASVNITNKGGVSNIVCQCDTSKGFIDNGSGICVCNTNTGFINNGNGKCSCDTSKGFVYSNGTCVCDSKYVSVNRTKFGLITTFCLCNDSAGFIDVSRTNLTCACDTSNYFVDDGKGGCTCSTNTTLSNNNPLRCSCDSSRNFYVANDGSCLCPSTFFYNSTAQLATCTCPSSYQRLDAGGDYDVCCNGNAGFTGPDSNTNCYCNSNLGFLPNNTNTSSCICSPNAVNLNGTCQCNIPNCTLYANINGTCPLNSLPLTNPANVTQCTCNSNFIPSYNGTSLICTCPEQFTYNATIETCTCNSTYEISRGTPYSSCCNYLKGFTGDKNGGCVCNINRKFLLTANNTCDCNTTAGFVNTGRQCECDSTLGLISDRHGDCICNAGRNFNVTKTVNGTCSCINNLVPFTNGDLVCICPAGSHFNETTNICSSCAVGTYSMLGDFTCTECLEGTYSNIIGATSNSTCLQCPAGTYSSYAASTCTSCGPNSVSPPGSNSFACTDCSLSGKVASTDNTTCICTANTTFNSYPNLIAKGCYTNGNTLSVVSTGFNIGTLTNTTAYDSNSCSYNIFYTCSAPGYTQASQTVTCNSQGCQIINDVYGQICPVNTYSNGMNCNSCPQYSTSTAGSTSNVNCTCLPGLTLSGNQCQCQGNTFLNSTYSCVGCDTGTTLSTDVINVLSNNTINVNGNSISIPKCNINCSINNIFCEQNIEIIVLSCPNVQLSNIDVTGSNVQVSITGCAF
jgi:hypothetical protein